MLINRLFILLFCVLIFSDNAYASADKENNEQEEEKNSGKTSAESPGSGDCSALFQEISDEINSLGECWQDSDCLVVNFGCPWQEAPCHHSVAGVEEQDKYTAVLDRIKSFNNTCLDMDDKLRKICADYNKTASDKVCVAQKLQCINGRCITNAELIAEHNSSANDLPEGRGNIWDRVGKYKKGTSRLERYFEKRGLDYTMPEQLTGESSIEKEQEDVTAD